MIIQFVFLCNLKELHTFLTLAQNQQDLKAGIADDPQQEKGYYNQIATNIEEIGSDQYQLGFCNESYSLEQLI